MATADSTAATWPNPQAAAHPQAAEIIRQIDFYFGDDNLRQDAHLLALFQEGKGTVSFNEVCGWPKMRRFKQRAAIRESIRQGSTVVDITKDGKRIKLKHAPTKPMTVVPKINENRKKIIVPEDKPWLTKAMMKPTGFEENVTEGPIRPEDYEEDQQDYDPDISVLERFEKAAMKFAARRKMHQETRNIFSKFLTFGGMDGGQSQFMGGLDDKTMEDMTKREIAERTVNYMHTERALDGYYADPPTWFVDFEAIAKGFFSSQFINFANWYDEDQVRTATNVLRNFYNYLLLHDACPEYKGQILAARNVCDIAEEELIKLSMVDSRLPGGFNVACSTLFEGNYAGLHAGGAEWAKEDDNLGWTEKDARTVFLAGIFAHGTEEQLMRVQVASESGTSVKDKFEVVSEETLGLEVVEAKLVSGEAKRIYDDSRFANTFVKPMGKLRCKRWKVPHAKPMDLPESVLQAQKDEDFEFIMDEEILGYCYPGLKMEACVKELDLGIKFIDYFEATYASFFTWLPNERIREWKEPGSPKAWMARKNAERKGAIAIREDVEDENDFDDELPD